MTSRNGAATGVAVVEAQVDAVLKVLAQAVPAGVALGAPVALREHEGPGYALALTSGTGSGQLLVQPLATGLARETCLEYPAKLLSSAFGEHVERLLAKRRRAPLARRRAARRATRQLSRPILRPPAPAALCYPPIDLPYRQRPTRSLGSPSVDESAVLTAGARYNTHSHHVWSAVLSGNYVEERSRTAECPELSFAPWGGEVDQSGYARGAPSVHSHPSSPIQQLSLCGRESQAARCARHLRAAERPARLGAAAQPSTNPDARAVREPSEVRRKLGSGNVCGRRLSDTVV